MRAARWAAAWGPRIRAELGLALADLRPGGAGKPRDVPAPRWWALKVAELHPDFQARFQGFTAAAQSVARQHGTDLRIWDAARTLERQLALYRQGRDRPGKIVTHAIVAPTGHLWGLAVDLVRIDARGQPRWDHPDWYVREVLPLAARHGLESLYLARGVDRPHVQVPAAEVPAAVRALAARVRRSWVGLP